MHCFSCVCAVCFPLLLSLHLQQRGMWLQQFKEQQHLQRQKRQQQQQCQYQDGLLGSTVEEGLQRYSSTQLALRCMHYVRDQQGVYS